MATRRSARLQARQQRIKNAVSPETSNCKDPSLFCLCLQPDDGCFMICCDQCNVWFHGDCVGITSAGENSMLLGMIGGSLVPDVHIL